MGSVISDRTIMYSFTAVFMYMYTCWHTERHTHTYTHTQISEGWEERGRGRKWRHLKSTIKS